MNMTKKFSPKWPDEIVTVEFDFRKLCTTTTTAVVVSSRVSGTADPAPETIVLGAAVNFGGIIQQRIQAGVEDTDYELLCTVETTEGGGQKFQLAGILPVRKAKA